MNIYPAIDIRKGKCVRLNQGDFSKETVYLEDPTEAAKRWQNKGAKWIHVVDLDGAKSGNPVNIDVIKRIRKTVDVNIQLGGGIRDEETAENYINLGIDRIIFGSSAVKNLSLIETAIKKFGAEKVAVGLDVRKDEVAINGWVKDSGVKTEEMLKKLKNTGLKTIIYTDISKDGMMQGPNIAGIEKVLSFDDFSVIASGGISSMQDLEQLARYEKKGLDGAIIGKALYNGTLNLKAVLEQFSLQ
ncbi:phosphoribosylformimino-5-aminoimidazole carboxamide isomerase [Tepidanaerobacter acetatoxydans Re1]|uniref:1-(5-phosphoribosyl)-5-[(5-phosphoribosylamino)methylideneamino] imidazole-4-carboxamide isomerase n=1 Tax=Tepidanaerobacter acetatoxydans (strain DSM 21804 / JCM 16047 / Re1) TaxID=1209989 RepID=F4LW75_TEPAE|nr:1-(5-phosphoribosyl)-5-[(5-phosphoribosylamino)methylideneamino]imidazole-4-carboxamide isomerase [Tepidanaerobacter acetatoxydans]AEE90851.1 1-(5-phosphoribosyl)-5-((5-phosphoribosylamino)methylideneamino) imidazole-4-carboxamide isomerase [Tepidanaerobacter acetatoxydans Re1]CDI40464.1 phosphoribosylformimino-5-aminoimidazole carboxamide isomerase [Tepidanaerobacter acetatoxydans Re1]